MLRPILTEDCVWGWYCQTYNWLEYNHSVTSESAIPVVRPIYWLELISAVWQILTTMSYWQTTATDNIEAHMAWHHNNIKHTNLPKKGTNIEDAAEATGLCGNSQPSLSMHAKLNFYLWKVKYIVLIQNYLNITTKCA